MAKIFTDTNPPTLDYARAAEALKAGREVAVVHAAALLDIAVTLNGLLQLAQQAEGSFELDDDDTRDEDIDDDRPGDGFEARPLEVGDLVVPVDSVDYTPVTVLALGTSEGADWAEVEGLGRVWVETITRVEPEQADDPDADFEPAKPKKSKKGKGDDA